MVQGSGRGLESAPQACLRGQVWALWDALRHSEQMCEWPAVVQPVKALKRPQTVPLPSTRSSCPP